MNVSRANSRDLFVRSRMQSSPVVGPSDEIRKTQLGISFCKKTSRNASEYAGAHYGAGITLIETLVSLGLLTFAVAGPMTLAAHSIKASGAIRNEMVATHLAEEGLEAAHSLRDNKSADDNSNRQGATNGYAWMQGVYDNCKTAPGCVIDVTQHAASNVWNYGAAIIPCPADCSALSILYLNPLTGLYRQSVAALGSPWVPTQFKRTILMSGTDDLTTPQRQVRVTATVTFPGYGGVTRTLRVTQDVYNWFPFLP